jgi:hypothetical protein
MIGQPTLTPTDPRIAHAVEDLRGEGIAVTVTVERRPDTAGRTCVDNLFVRVTHSPASAPATWMAVHCAFWRYLPYVPVHQA